MRSSVVPPSWIVRFAVHHLVRNNNVQAFKLRKPFLGAAVRNHSSAGILEHLAAGNVVIVVMAVDQVLDRRFGDLADFFQIGFCRLRAPVADRIGDDYACWRDNEH